MLRGQATLQSIIGRNSISKRPSQKQRKSRTASDSNPAHAQPDQGVSKPTRGKELLLGQVHCPACGCCVEGDEANVNAHLDKCLVKLAAIRGKAQSTLSQYARSDSGHTRKQQRLGSSHSCPDLPQQDPSACRTVSGSEDGLRTRSGRVLGSPSRQQASSQEQVLPSAFQLSEEHPSEASSGSRDSAGGSELPLRRSLRSRRSSGPGLPDDVHGAVRSRLRSATAIEADPRQEASAVCDEIVLERKRLLPEAAVALMQTELVGRRYHHSAAAHVGQLAHVEHEARNPRDSNALVATAGGPAGHVLGYLPAKLSAHLAPLLLQGYVSAQVKVLALGATKPAPLSVELMVWKEGEGEEHREEVDQGLASLQEAAVAHEHISLQRSSSGSGAVLRTNFLLLLETVSEQDGHLLTAEESGVFQAYQAMPEVAQMLFLRLFLRSGPWFRLLSLAYSEVASVPAAVADIKAAGLAASLTDVPLEERRTAVKCLTVVELTSLLASQSLLPEQRRGAGGRGLSRAQLARVLADGLADPTKGEAVLAVVTRLTGPCLRLNEAACEAFRRAQRLFFLNEAQDLSRFLVADLGIMRYPEYQVQRVRPVFPNRHALLAYEQGLLHATALDDALERGDAGAAEAALEPALAAIDAGHHKAAGSVEYDFLQRFSAAWIYTSMATTGISLLEKQRRYGDACELLRKLLGGRCCPARRGEWWVRLSLDTEHLGRAGESLEVAEAALADEWVKHGERLALQKRILRLGKPPRRWKRPPWAQAAQWEPREVRIEAQPLPNALGVKSRFLCPSGEGECTVEELALAWYAEEAHGSWQGVHAEGGIFATLFGLLLWDVLFMALPDVFRNPFQTAPLDLPTPAFFPARKQALSACLAHIRDGQGPHMIRQRWQASRGTMCVGVNWDRHDVEDLAVIAACIGGPGLATVCHLLAEDRAGWQGGMPDLLLWNPATGRAKLSEVKGPRDHLSHQQRAWLQALTTAGLDSEVLKVVEPKTGAYRKPRRKMW